MLLLVILLVVMTMLMLVSREGARARRATEATTNEDHGCRPKVASTGDGAAR